MTALSAGKLWGMRRMADAKGLFKMVAVDQRPPIKNPIKAARGTAEAPYDDVAGFKLMLVEELQRDASAMLLDPHFALPRGFSILSPAKGLIVTLEDSLFRETPGGRLSSEIDDWSVEKIKRCGGDAVKVLAWYRPDADLSVNLAQQDFTQRIGEACARFDIPFLFELLVYPLAKDTHQTTDYVEMEGKHADHVLDSVREFAKPKYGVDVFKLESPVPAKGIDRADRAATQKLFDEMGTAGGAPLGDALGRRRHGGVPHRDGARLRGGRLRLSRRPRDLGRAVQGLPRLGGDPRRPARPEHPIRRRPQRADRRERHALVRSSALRRQGRGGASGRELPTQVWGGVTCP